LSAANGPLLHLFSPKTMFIDLPSVVLPTVGEAVYMHVADSAPSLTFFMVFALLVVFIRAFSELEAFPMVQILVRTIAQAYAAIMVTLLIMGMACLLLTLIYGLQFFPELANDAEKDWFFMFLSTFQIIIAGSEVNDTVWAYSRGSVVVLYFFSNVLLFLVMSQIFIAILVASWDAAIAAREERHRDASLPPDYQDCGEPSSALTRGSSTLLYWFCGWDCEHGGFGPALLRALHQQLARAEAAVLRHAVLVVTVARPSFNVSSERFNLQAGRRPTRRCAKLRSCWTRPS